MILEQEALPTSNRQIILLTLAGLKEGTIIGGVPLQGIIQQQFERDVHPWEVIKICRAARCVGPSNEQHPFVRLPIQPCHEKKCPFRALPPGQGKINRLVCPASLPYVTQKSEIL